MLEVSLGRGYAIDFKRVSGRLCTERIEKSRLITENRTVYRRAWDRTLGADREDS